MVGPGSKRPDTGDLYEMIGEPLPAIDELPVFEDYSSQKSEPERSPAISPVIVDIGGRGVPEGQRFDTLKVKAREFARNVSSKQELHDALVAYVNAAFEDPASFEPQKIEQITEWNWQKRLEGNLWGGTNSPVQVLPHELDRLDQHKNGANALRLVLELRRWHSAQPGKRFSIATHAMANAHVISGWSESRYRRAKKPLLDLGLLVQTIKGNPKRPSLYQLASLAIPAE